MLDRVDRHLLLEELVLVHLRRLLGAELLPLAISPTLVPANTQAEAASALEPGDSHGDMLNSNHAGAGGCGSEAL
jgi:hypothetical protein